MSRLSWIPLSLSCLLLACPEPSQNRDASPLADSAGLDVGFADSSLADHSAADVAVADGAAGDTANHDAVTTDTVTTDARQPDAHEPAGSECANWQTQHPDWIFCDDFESGDPLVGPGRYFEYGDDEGDCVVADGVGLSSSAGLQVHFETGEVSAGGLKLGFGRNPSGYMNKGIKTDQDFREIWYRHYLKNEAGWIGNPAKLSRATVIAASDWSQAMIAHLWSDGAEHLLIDPASCVDASGNVLCSGYNDFSNLDWLGNQSGTTAIFSTALSDRWFCIEHHVKLNDPGQSNGVTEFWIDGQLEARRDGLDFVGSYSDYAINAVFLENYWNSGSARDQARYFDNFVVSTQPIGCL